MEGLHTTPRFATQRDRQRARKLLVGWTSEGPIGEKMLQWRTESTLV